MRSAFGWFALLLAAPAFADVPPTVGQLTDSMPLLSPGNEQFESFSATVAMPPLMTCGITAMLRVSNVCGIRPAGRVAHAYKNCCEIALPRLFLLDCKQRRVPSFTKPP